MHKINVKLFLLGVVGRLAVGCEWRSSFVRCKVVDAAWSSIFRKDRYETEFGEAGEVDGRIVRLSLF